MKPIYYGVCPECGKRFRLDRNGKLSAHLEPSINVPNPLVEPVALSASCVGSQQEPRKS